MAKKNKNNKDKNKRYKAPFERMLRKKAASFVKAERDYWKHRYEIEKQYRENAKTLDLNVPSTIPDELSSIVWALMDGVVFVRYHSPGRNGDVSFRSWNISLKQWGNEALIIPTPQGEMSLAKSRLVRGLPNILIHGGTLNGVKIPYAEVRHEYYDRGHMSSPIERAVIDFQLALLGMQFRDRENVQLGIYKNEDIIGILRDIATRFESLLNDADREEDLHTYLKNNPMILHPTAEVIPKKKLGEDFITDFVLVIPSDQGPTYTLVEIEKSSHPILVKDNSLSSQANHALKQTRDWDVWLEQNKAYLQTKLPGFETPKYMVIIGRGNTLDDTAKAYLRSYNRDLKNTELLTFDDVLVRFHGMISNLSTAINSSNNEKSAQ